MKLRSILVMSVTLAVTFRSDAVSAADMAGEIHGLQFTLDHVYSDMLPMCGQLIGVGRAIAGFGALWYIGSRVWRQIASAEPVDFFPLLRPFALGLAILMFPAVIAVMNGIMQPVVAATGNMVQNSDKAIARLLEAKQRAIEKTDAWQMYEGDEGSGNREQWYKYTHPDDPGGKGEGILEGIGNDMKFAMEKASYRFRNTVKQWMSEVLQLLYEAASLCINTIRTFYLIVLAILGPLVFGIAVFDGFQHTLSAWMAKYLNVFLWLPVANIFGAIIGKVQENMLQLDISQVETSGDTFFSSTDTAYLIFLTIGIVGYITVPSVAGYIVNAGGINPLLQKVNMLVSQSTHSTTVIGGSAVSRLTNSLNGAMGNSSDSSSTTRSTGTSEDQYQRSRLS